MNNYINWPSWPQYGKEEASAVNRVIKSNQIFAGKEVRKFEYLFAKYIKSKYAIGLGNATHGLHLALAALNIGEGDEVIVTSYSWISSASCILMQNAVPVFCDIEKKSLGICPKDLKNKITNKTKAIIVVHMFGYPARINKIKEIADKFSIPIIEDASHAHGSEINGKKAGTFGLISVFSLHQRKSLSVGDGGIVCTNNKFIFEKISKLRSFGHDELSYNFRMTEFAGALGQIGIKNLDWQNNERIKNAIYLAKLLKGHKKIKVRLPLRNEKSVFYAVLIEVNDDKINIKSKLNKLQKIGIPIRETWEPLQKHPHFNPKIIPARGLPWKSEKYQGSMRNVIYKNLKLDNVNNLCPSKILELYVHPPTSKKEIDFAAKNMIEIFG